MNFTPVFVTTTWLSAVCLISVTDWNLTDCFLCTLITVGLSVTALASKRARLLCEWTLTD